MPEAPTNPDGAPQQVLVGRPLTVTDSLLRLLFARKLYLVGKAMAEQYPTDADIEDMILDHETIEQLTGVTQIANDIRAERLRRQVNDIGEMIKLIGQHYDRAVEELELFAEAHGIDPHDLLVVITRDY